MGAAPVEIRSVADADLEAAGIAIARAFQEEPILVHVLPDPIERAQRAPAFFSIGLAYARLIGIAYAPMDASMGAVFGWYRPAAVIPPERLAEAGIRPLPDVLGADAATRFAALIDHIESVQDQLVPPPWWSLAAVGVNPTWQGRGIGRALVQAFLSRATEDGVPTCLWTDRLANVKFYRGLGMELIGEGIAPESEVPYWLFRWDPA